MNIDLAALPNDVDTLHWMIGDLAAALDSQRVEAQAEIKPATVYLFLEKIGILSPV
jgi:hypothetical protein